MEALVVRLEEELLLPLDEKGEHSTMSVEEGG